MSTLRALLVLFPSLAAALAPSVQLKDVALGGQRFAVVAMVSGPALPITVTLEPGSEYLNCTPSSPLPLSRVISTPGETVLVEVGPADAKAKWRCPSRSRSRGAPAGRRRKASSSRKTKRPCGPRRDARLLDQP